MALQVDKAGGGSLLNELGVQLLIARAEGHVHAGTGALLSVALEETGVVQSIIEHVGPLPLQLLHAFQTALLVDPVQGESQHVDAPAGRCIVHGVLVDHGLIVHHQRGVGQLVASQVLADDDHGEAGGGHVLLGSGIEDAILGHVYGHGQNVGGHVAHQRHIAGFGDIVPLGAVDGVVGAVVEVAGLRVQLDLLLAGDVAVIPVGRGDSQVNLAVLLSLFISKVGEVSGDGIIRLSGLADEVEGDHGELSGRSGLEKQDLIPLRHIHQPAQLILGLLKNLHKDLRAVTHLHH